MATYIIGDLQGCFDELQQLLKQIDYDRDQDELWFAGDIVNRGPKSLECLQFVHALNLEGKAKMVLGNHDFQLLAAYCGLHDYASKSDTLEPILIHPDGDALINWLRQQPLMIHHPVHSVAMVHAGIPPQWRINEALDHAQEVSRVLCGDHWQDFIQHHLFGSKPKQWHDGLQSWGRLRYIVNAFTRMRFCNPQGKLDFKRKQSPQEAMRNKSDFLPWFVHPNRKNKTSELFFGHWSTLGAMDAYQVHSTDTGCLWGGHLTAYCLETHKRHLLSCNIICQPKSNS